VRGKDHEGKTMILEGGFGRENKVTSNQETCQGFDYYIIIMIGRRSIKDKVRINGRKMWD
jgi:hypothetical protein